MIEVQKIQKIFKTKEKTFTAVDDISFSAEKGEIVSVIGPNGAGKTTLIKMIGNYLTPTKGTIVIDESNSKRSLSIGVVFGGEQGFYGRVSAYENLMFFGRLKKIPKQELKDQVKSALEKVDLLDVSTKNVGEFSRGMKQRLHIARALLGNPSIILLDEPTTGLDAEIAFEIRKVVEELKKQGKTIILTSHKMDEIERLADKIVVIGAGKVFFNGSIKEFKNSVEVHTLKTFDNLEDAYLAISPQLKRVV